MVCALAPTARPRPGPATVGGDQRPCRSVARTCAGAVRKLDVPPVRPPLSTVEERNRRRSAGTTGGRARIGTHRRSARAAFRRALGPGPAGGRRGDGLVVQRARPRPGASLNGAGRRPGRGGRGVDVVAWGAPGRVGPPIRPAGWGVCLVARFARGLVAGPFRRAGDGQGWAGRDG